MKSEFQNYDDMKKKLALKVIPVVGNKKLLRSTPHTELQDMALVYQILNNKRTEENQIVTNRMLRECHVTQEQIHEDALKYAPMNRPLSIEKSGYSYEEYSDDDVLVRKVDFFEATCGKRGYGAECLFYPEFLKRAAETVGENYYIFPASVNRVVLVPDTGRFTAHDLEDISIMIRHTLVEPGTALTDKVYHYDMSGNLFETADDFAQRQETTASQEQLQQGCLEMIM